MYSRVLHYRSYNSSYILLLLVCEDGPYWEQPKGLKSKLKDVLKCEEENKTIFQTIVINSCPTADDLKDDPPAFPGSKRKIFITIVGNFVCFLLRIQVDFF